MTLLLSLFNRQGHVHPVVMVLKYVVDKYTAIVGLLITAFLFPFIAIAIKVNSKGPIFFSQLRIGRMEEKQTRLFNIYKFRTMYIDAEQFEQQRAKKNDTRIT